MSLDVLLGYCEMVSHLKKSEKSPKSGETVARFAAVVLGEKEVDLEKLSNNGYIRKSCFLALTPGQQCVTACKKYKSAIY